MNNPTQMFNVNYYQHNCGLPYERSQEFLNFFNSVARRIVQEINPTSVLDAGCAMGFLVEGLRNENIDAFGVDISEYAISRAHAGIQSYVKVGSITDPFPQTYDLIVCIEVLEHMPKEDSEKAIANFCRFTDDVLFSSTPFDYKEATHFNVQPPDYWAEQFARHGFYRDFDFDASFITTWAVRFRHRKEPFYRIIKEYDRKTWVLVKENQDLRALANEMQIQLSSDRPQKIDEMDLQLSSPESNIAQLQNEIRQLNQKNILYEDRWADLQKGFMWRLMQNIWSIRLFLIPHGSKRENWLLKLKSKL